jgi:hypothetical protein
MVNYRREKTHLDSVGGHAADSDRRVVVEIDQGAATSAGPTSSSPRRGGSRRLVHPILVRADA